ncbi:MAG: ribosomal protein S2, flavodoxin-like domain-containing protein [Monoraphidium minutum]|nr:MAG: ribosomal protein S2, flavodoxin-like domain-containing protein [Monoraphidium minutum]
MQQLRAPSGGALQHAVRALLGALPARACAAAGASGGGGAAASQQQLAGGPACWWGASAWQRFSSTAGLGGEDGSSGATSSSGGAIAHDGGGGDDGGAAQAAHAAAAAAASSSAAEGAAAADAGDGAAAASSDGAAAASSGGAAAGGGGGGGPLSEAVPGEDARLERLMRVLLHPISRTRRWTGQLSPHLVHVNGQLFVEPHAVLSSMLRALHVIRGVLEEDGHVYIVETSPLLRPLLREAARSCVNPNMWFMENSWPRGLITNAASHRRLFLPSHQPNRRLFLEKGLRMVNPHCPEPRRAPPRLEWRDKWALYTRSDRPGFRGLLQDVLDAEHAQHTLKPPRTLSGRGRSLGLLVVLDTTRNAVALQEAAQRGVPTVALASGQVDMSSVTYPVLARDFSPAFVHFFLDNIVKLANVKAPALGAAGGGAAAQAAAA